MARSVRPAIEASPSRHLCPTSPARLAVRLLALSLAAGMSIGVTLPSPAAEGGKKNIFAQPEPASEPGFKKGPDSPSAIQDRAIPDMRMVIAMPSLAAAQRKEIQKLYKESQTRLAKLRTDMNSLRSRAQKAAELERQNANGESALAGGRQKSDGESSATDTGGQNGAGESSMSELKPSGAAKSEPGNSQNPPAQDLMVEVPNKQSAKVLLMQVRELQSQIRAERENLWDQVRPILSDQQIEDLGKMRRGEFMPQATEAAK